MMDVRVSVLSRLIAPALVGLVAFGFLPAHADDLYKSQPFAALASDRVASRVGDSLTVVVIQAAEARNSAAASSAKGYNLGASVDAGSTSESLSLNFDRDSDLRGEVRRSQSFTTQLAVTVVEVIPNGDLVVSGEQRMLVNGQATTLRVAGRVRPADIQSDNRVPSNRVADARIEFDAVDRVNERQRRGALVWLGNWFRGIF
jgi:flagellar L-ring protein precursor FlgH